MEKITWNKLTKEILYGKEEREEDSYAKELAEAALYKKASDKKQLSKKRFNDLEKLLFDKK